MVGKSAWESGESNEDKALSRHFSFPTREAQDVMYY